MAWVLDNWTVNYHDRTWDNLKTEIKEIRFIQDLINRGNYNHELPDKWFGSSVQTVLEEREERHKKRKTTTWKARVNFDLHREVDYLE